MGIHPTESPRTHLPPNFARHLTTRHKTNNVTANAHQQEEHCERKTLRTLSKMIECPLRCGHLILRQWEFQHRTFDCPKRPARCPGGCSADVSAEEAATHFKTCGRRRIR